MRFFALIGALGILAAIAVAAYLFTGYYDVAADAPGGFIDVALVHIRDASISHFASGIPPMSLDDPATIQAGASNFAKVGCVTCHSGPGVQRAAFAKGAMNPGPPGLRTMSKLEPAEIFWVVKNGIRMTAMPSFGKAGVPANDIWQIVAFVKKAPKISPADYQAWTAPPAPPPPAASVPPAQEAAPAPAAPAGETH
jgi:Cytochrome C oxidase, cbb3-type, subunit III